MANTIHDIGIASQIGTYRDAVEVPANARWFCTAGTPGLGPDGSLAPDVTGQAAAAWGHVIALLEKADMTIADVVNVTQYLVRADDIPAYAEVRARFLGAARPASTLLVVPALVRPDLLLEVEVLAAKA